MVDGKEHLVLTGLQSVQAVCNGCAMISINTVSHCLYLFSGPLYMQNMHLRQPASQIITITKMHRYGKANYLAVTS